VIADAVRSTVAGEQTAVGLLIIRFVVGLTVIPTLEEEPEHPEAIGVIM